MLSWRIQTEPGLPPNQAMIRCFLKESTIGRVRRLPASALEIQTSVPHGQQIEERNQIRVGQMNAAAGSRLADAHLVRRAVDVNVARVRIHVAAAVEAGFESFQPQNARGDFGVRQIPAATCGRRAGAPLKTVPAGPPPPIFSAMRCNPSGVQFEPSVCPMPKREVEQGNF